MKDVYQFFNYSLKIFYVIKHSYTSFNDYIMHFIFLQWYALSVSYYLVFKVFCYFGGITVEIFFGWMCPYTFPW